MELREEVVEAFAHVLSQIEELQSFMATVENMEEVKDDFRDVRRIIDELSNNLKWQMEEHEKFVANIEGLETEVDNLAQQLKIMNRAVEGMAQLLATHMGLPLADVYFNH